MDGLQTTVSPVAGCFQTLLGLCDLVAGDVLVVLDVRADGNEHHRLVGPSHADDTIRAGYCPAVGLNGHASHKANLALQTLVLGRDTVEIGVSDGGTVGHIII